MTTTVTARGQVTIPKSVRDLLGIVQGSPVDFVRASRSQSRPRSSRSFPSSSPEHLCTGKTRSSRGHPPFGSWPRSRPTISKRRKPPAKPKRRMARSRRPRSVPGVERFQHGEKIDEEDGFPLTGRGGCLLPIASGEPSGEMPVLRVERLTALRKVPGSATTGGCRWSTPTCCPSAEPEGLGLERPAVCGSGGCGSND